MATALQGIKFAMSRYAVTKSQSISSSTSEPADSMSKYAPRNIDLGR